MLNDNFMKNAYSNRFLNIFKIQCEIKIRMTAYVGATSGYESNHTSEQHFVLLKVWCRSTKTKLKPVHVLGNTYFLMSPYDLDELCQWVRNKRSFL